MSDLISRQAAIDVAVQSIKDWDGMFIQEANCRIRDAINDLPSAQPEIIRCRDCEHRDKAWTNDWFPDYYYCPMVGGVRKGDFYCGDGERRTDEQI